MYMNQDFFQNDATEKKYKMLLRLIQIENFIKKTVYQMFAPIQIHSHPFIVFVSFAV